MLQIKHVIRNSKYKPFNEHDNCKRSFFDINIQN